MMFSRCLVAAAAACVAVPALASPFSMSYCVAPNGSGQFQYTFKLKCDNHDGTWAAGRGIGWVVYADAQGGSSPLADFHGDSASLPVGPWTEYDSSSGGHNGPTLGPVVVQTPPYPLLYWIPTAVGQE